MENEYYERLNMPWTQQKSKIKRNSSEKAVERIKFLES